MNQDDVAEQRDYCHMNHVFEDYLHPNLQQFTLICLWLIWSRSLFYEWHNFQDIHKIASKQCPRGSLAQVHRLPAVYIMFKVDLAHIVIVISLMAEFSGY